MVSFTEFDKSVKSLFENALKWQRLLLRNKEEWNPNKGQILELTPNFKNKYDYKWIKEKNKLNNSDISEDEYFESILLPTTDFKVLTIENLYIIINGEELSVPSMRFEKSSGYFLHPLNC